MSQALAELATQAAERLRQANPDNGDEMRYEVGYTTGVLDALAVALRPDPPVLRDVATSRSGATS